MENRHKYTGTTPELLSEDPGGSQKQQSNFPESEEEKGDCRRHRVEAFSTLDSP